MAFSDRPIIDSASINSDISAVELKTQLNQYSGFICREDVPDKGCDFDVELIVDGHQASNWRFALQLKSIVNPVFVENGQYISYPFETSRLGYLIRRQPSMGIIVLYSVPDKKLYFDYVDAIYRRLIEERDSDDWKENDKVNIRIPISNYLNEVTIKDLHSSFLRRFENAQMMQSTYGAKYNLPVINIDESALKDINDDKYVIDMLKKYGIALLSSYDLDIVYQMICGLSMAKINTDQELQKIAAIVYCEVGQHAEAAYYFDKLIKRKDVEIDETIQFSKLKNDFSLGNIELDGFIKEIALLRNNMSNSVNSVTIDLNLIHFELISMVKNGAENVDVLQLSIQGLFERIKELQTEEHIKAMLEAWNADNYALLIGHIRSKAYAEANILKSIGQELSLEEKRKRVLFLLGFEQDFTNHLGNVIAVAKKLKNDILFANAISTLNRHALSHQLDLIAFNVDTTDLESKENHLKHNIGQSLNAYNIFIEKPQYKEAYHSICNAIDFVIIIRDWYGNNEDWRIEEMYSIKTKLEEDLVLDVYESPFPKLIERSKTQSAESSQASDYKDFTDSQIEYLSKLMLNTMGLPQDRLINIINELKAYRLFYSRCTNPSLQPLIYSPYIKEEEERYSSPVRFVIRSTVTGIETPPSSNMELLLGYWSL